MRLTGLHLLLTYQCTSACDHCFVWSGPGQPGTMTRAQLRVILEEAHGVGGIEWIYFEGGEPFLYYALLVHGVQQAHAMGFRVGVVTNAYWATTAADATECLRPFAGKVADLSVSSDLYHGDEKRSHRARNAGDAAARLGIPFHVLSIAGPSVSASAVRVGQLQPGESAVRFRGRAVDKLVDRAALAESARFTSCPYENLRDPGRLHVDPYGLLHVCQGIVVGNLFEESLASICASYAPGAHPIVGPLLRGGPLELARRYGVVHPPRVADACHLCTLARRSLRTRFPASLAPAQVYGALTTA